MINPGNNPDLLKTSVDNSMRWHRKLIDANEDREQAQKERDEALAEKEQALAERDQAFDEMIERNVHYQVDMKEMIEHWLQARLSLSVLAAALGASLVMNIVLILVLVL